MNEPRRRCPVCWRRVRPTKQIQRIHGRWDLEAVIEGHWDTVGRDICPASYEIYRITLNSVVHRQAVAA